MDDSNDDRPAFECDIDYASLSEEQRCLITPQMLEAGLMVYLKHDSRFDSDETGVASIYCAMVGASQGRQVAVSAAVAKRRAKTLRRPKKVRTQDGPVVLESPDGSITIWPTRRMALAQGVLRRGSTGAKKKR